MSCKKNLFNQCLLPFMRDANSLQLPVKIFKVAEKFITMDVSIVEASDAVNKSISSCII